MTEEQEALPPQRMREAFLSHIWEYDGESGEETLPDVSQMQRKIEKRGVTGLAGGADTLPVLSAFQDFLETERMRTRGRMLALTGFFVIVLLVVLGSGILVGALFLNQTHRDIADMEDDLAAVQEIAGQVRDTALAAVAKVTGNANRLREEISAERGTLSDMQKKVGAELTGFGGELKELRAQAATLQAENKVLRQRLGEMAALWPAVSNSVAQAFAELAVLRSAVDAPSASRVAAAPLPPEPAPPAPPELETPLRDSIVMSILPHGTRSAVDWRLPIPE